MLKSIRVFPFSFAEFTEYLKGEELADFLRSAPEHVPQSRHRLLLGLADDYIRAGGYPETVIAFDPNRSHFLPKRYLHDLGIINLRRSLAVPQISILETIDPVLRTPLVGIFENFVLLSLVQGESAGYAVGGCKKGNNTEIEVDFIFDLLEENKKIPVECKASVNIKHKHFRNLLHYLDLSHQSFGILISAAPFQKITVEEKVIINVPVYLANKDNFSVYCKKFGT